MSATAPKIGDRVAMRLEGEVSTHDGGGLCVILDGCPEGHLKCVMIDDKVEVEVLGPKEPEWKHGDVIRVGVTHVLIHIFGGWECTCGYPHSPGFVPNAWRNGQVTILGPVS